MRKLMAAGMMILWILAGTSTGAKADLNTEDLLAPERFTLKGELNIMKNRSMEDGSIWWGEKKTRLSSEQFLLRGDYQATDRISLLITAGLANLEAHRFEGETHSFSEAFAFGSGLNALIFEDPEYNYRIDLGLQYFTFEPGEGKLTGISDHPPYSLSHKVTVDWEEWQLFLKFSKDLDFFVLYGGAKYSDVKCNQKRVWPGGNTEEITFKPEDNFGLFCGIDIDFLELAPNLSAYFEVKFIDETAFTLGLTYHF